MSDKDAIVTNEGYIITEESRRVGTLIGMVRELRASQDKGFDNVEKRLDKLDTEIDALHEATGTALREISRNAMRIEYLEANLSRIEQTLKSVEQEQYSCRARLNYEENTGQFQIVREKVDKALKRRSFTPPFGGAALSVKEWAPVLRYVAIAVFSALAAAGGVVAYAWTKFSTETKPTMAGRQGDLDK